MPKIRAEFIEDIAKRDFVFEKDGIPFFVGYKWQCIIIRIITTLF